MHSDNSFTAEDVPSSNADDNPPEQSHLEIPSQSDSKLSPGMQETVLSIEQEQLVLPPAHIFNPSHSVYLRYGVPVFLCATFALLLAADIGSGVSAMLEQSFPDTGEVLTTGEILTVSVISSVKKLWENSSYALAILIAITSISWPYAKLALSLFSWVAPFSLCWRPEGQNPSVLLAKREKLLFWLDVCGKWSFVDIFVLIVIMVAFRSTITLPYIVTDVWIEPKWGFYGFVTASMLSLAGTHLILHLHRHVQDELGAASNCALKSRSWDSKQNLVTLSESSPFVIGSAILVTLVLQICGALLNTFTFSYSGLNDFENSYSLLTIGSKIPESSRDPGNALIKLIQIFYYLLAIAIPIYSCLAWAILLFKKVTTHGAHRLFAMSEIALAWSSLDVYFISAIFSVAQIPKFGNGIVDTGCNTCHEVSARIEPIFAITCFAGLLNFALGLWLLNKAHSVIYGIESVNFCCSWSKRSQC